MFPLVKHEKGYRRMVKDAYQWQEICDYFYSLPLRQHAYQRVMGSSILFLCKCPCFVAKSAGAGVWIYLDIVSRSYRKWKKMCKTTQKVENKHEKKFETDLNSNWRVRVCIQYTRKRTQMVVFSTVLFLIPSTKEGKKDYLNFFSLFSEPKI